MEKKRWARSALSKQLRRELRCTCLRYAKFSDIVMGSRGDVAIMTENVAQLNIN